MENEKNKRNYKNYYKKYQNEKIQRYAVNLSKETFEKFKQACELEKVNRSEYLKKQIDIIIKKYNL